MYGICGVGLGILCRERNNGVCSKVIFRRLRHVTVIEAHQTDRSNLRTLEHQVLVKVDHLLVLVL